MCFFCFEWKTASLLLCLVKCVLYSLLIKTVEGEMQFFACSRKAWKNVNLQFPWSWIVNGLHVLMYIARINVKNNLHDALLCEHSSCLLVLYSKSCERHSETTFCFVLWQYLCVFVDLKERNNLLCHVQDKFISVSSLIWKHFNSFVR